MSEESPQNNDSNFLEMVEPGWLLLFALFIAGQSIGREDIGSHCGQLGGGLIGSGIAVGIGFGILIIFPALCKRHPAKLLDAIAISTGIVAIGAASVLGESLIGGRSGTYIGFAIGFGVVLIAVRCLWKFQQSAASVQRRHV